MSGFRYLLEPNSGDSHQSSPYWLALVVRYAIRDSYNRTRLLTGTLGRRDSNTAQDFDGPVDATSALPGAAVDWDMSRAECKENPVDEADPILLEHEIQQWSVSHGKSSPQGIATFQLHHAGTDYRRHIAAGDWIMFWAFDNQADYLRIRNNLRQAPKVRSNAFMDGFKFLGRIQGVRRTRRRQGSTGVMGTSYALSAVGFKELSYTIYYHPAMMSKYGKNNVQWMVDFGGEINQFLLGGDSGTGSIQAGDAIQKLLRVCMGLGPSAQWKNGVNPETIGSDSPPPPPLQPSPNGRVLIPATVAEVLLGETMGVQQQTRTYVDLLKSWIGVQDYPNRGRARRRQLMTDFAAQEATGEGFTPKTDGKLPGDFLPQPIDFNQKPVWSVLQTYLNEPINEMFTTLRTDPDGYIMPFLIARQTPFTSRAFAIAAGIDAPNKATPFVSLPRWVVSPKLVESEDLGQSDSLKFNFVFLPSRDVAAAGRSEFMNTNQNYVQNPPYVDTADVERSGLQMFTRVIGARVNPTMYGGPGPGRFWTRLMSDIVMGQHLRFTGSLNLTYIQEPIAIGDNCQYDGGIYHIERISHQGQIEPGGRRTSTTQLQLTHGISIESDKVGDNVYMVDEPLSGLRHPEATDRAPRDVDVEDHRIYVGHSEDRKSH